MAIIWEEKFSVGISLIDEQHKQFVWTMGKLSKAIEKMETKEALIGILNDLDQYVVYHFDTEEKYFKEFGYSEAEEHIKSHQEFIEKLSGIKENFLRDELRLSLELVVLLSDWLVNHVAGMDRKYIDCFNEHGLF
jgi:hemerythrin-like metal-binding protein